MQTRSPISWALCFVYFALNGSKHLWAPGAMEKQINLIGQSRGHFLFQGISLENNIENIIIGNASSHLYCNPSIKKVLYLHKWWWNDSFSSGQWDHISSVSPGQSFCQQTPPITKHENIDPLVDWWGGISARPSSSSSEKPSISSRLSLLPCHPDNWSTNEDYPSPHETLLGASLFTPVLTIGAKTQV